MANEMTGALDSVVPNTGSEPAAQNAQEAKPDPIAQSQERINKSQADLQIQYDRLMRLLDDRTSGEQQPISLGQFFASLVGSPESKYFSQSMGDTARNLQAQQEAQRKREMEIAQMRLEMGKSQLGMQTQELERKKQEATQQLIPNLYTKDQSGNYVFNAPVAQRLAQLTGKPEYVQQLVSEQRQKSLKEIGMNMFKPKEIEDVSGNKKTVYDFNPAAVFDIMKLSNNPLDDITKYAEMIPKLRKAGLLSGMKGDESTPFDAFILMPPSPIIKAQAENLARQYRNGMIDDDKANTLANQMLNMSTSHMDRVTSQMYQQGMQAVMMSMRQAEHERKLEVDRSKLTDEQKLAYKNQVIPIINEGNKADQALAELERLKSQFAKTPSGILQGIRANTWGALMRTDEAQALEQVQSMSKRLMNVVPRLPGPASNFDAQNILKGLGDLTDPKKTNEERVKLVDELETSYRNLLNRANQVEEYWETNKKLLPLADRSISAKPKKSDITDEDIKSTAKKYGITEAEVKKRLGIK